MASDSPSVLTFYRTKFLPWVWIIILLHLSSFVHSLQYSTLASDQAPRAALVTLAHDNDLPGMLYSIGQLEDKFNSRYQYHWVFFSTRELSEEFKRSTSNATNAICVYEVIPGEHWSVPNWVDHRRLYATENVEPGSEHDAERTVPDLRQIYRWNSGPFAREKRLRYYDWFLRVEPGAQFTRDIHFDVFRFMRDNGIAYGFNKAILDETSLRELSPRIRSFIDKNPDLLHKEADVSWLLDALDSNDSSIAAVGSEKVLSRQDIKDNYRKRIIWERPPSPVSPSQEADSQQVAEDDDDDEGTGSLADAFTSWLSGIYESSLYPTFEIGSLAFFRSPSHLAFFDHLDSAGDFYYKRVEDVPVHTLSASMFLPKQSVWNFRKTETRHYHHGPSLPEETPDPEFDLKGVEADWRHSMTPNGNTKKAMAALLARWDWMARDMGSHEGGLMSGCTIVDERNFAIIGLCILPDTI
ncbi:Fc.00g114000.m01.CDS01 [Cosmosporella sp. VM-42]